MVDVQQNGDTQLLIDVNEVLHHLLGGHGVEGGDRLARPDESGKALRQFRRGIGMVFQSFNLVTRTTVIKNVLSACVPDMPFWRVLLGAFRMKRGEDGTAEGSCLCVSSPRLGKFWLSSRRSAPE